MIVGVGADLSDIRRIQTSLDRFGERFKQRCFTDLERARSDRKPDPAWSYAKRFAAKEACAKALGTGMRADVYWRDMGVVNLPSGQPTLKLTGHAAEHLARLTPPGHEARIHLTLSDEHPYALAFVVIGIMIYLSMRFEWKYAVAGIIANLHDVIIILGFFAFFQWEFSLSVLAAILAVLGYSVNESVVIFDRIRENFRRYRKMSTVEIINNSITANISRTIITHGSTQIMVLSMLLFGGETLHYFSVALTIGILFGIYSSVFVAAAIAMWLGIKREDLVKGGRKEGDANDPNSGAVV